MLGKLKNLLLAAMALMLFAGCSNIALDDAVVEGGDAGDKYVLTIGVDGFKNYSARYISPTAYASNTQFSKLLLSGVSNSKKSFNDTELTPVNGVYKIPLNPDVWYLTLKAYREENGGEKYVLKGESTVDLRHGASSVTFKLTTDGVTTAGSVSLSGTFDDPDGIVKKYKAGLYNIDTDALVSNSETLLTAVDEESKTFTYAPTATFKPGSYLFKLTPYKLKLGSTTEYEPCATVYAEMIDIAPGRTTSKTTVSITGIETKPTAPTGLNAVLVQSSEIDCDNYYTVKLRWTPTSYNEEGFILRLYKANSSGVINTSSDTPFAIFTNKKSHAADANKVFVESKEYRVSGNLGRATSECEIKLPTGELFEVTINSWNEVGEGVNVSNVVAACSRGAATAGTGETAFAAGKSINRTMVTYNLNGGAYDGSRTSLIDYFTYDSESSYSLLPYTGSSFDSTKLVKGEDENEHAFTYWTSVINGLLTDKKETYNGYKDLTVWAAYNEDVTINVTTEDLYPALTLAKVEDNSEELTASSGVYTVHESNTITSVTFTVGQNAVEDGDGNVTTPAQTFDEISVFLRGVEVATGSGRTVTVDLAKVVDGGKYTVTIIAKKTAETKVYSCNTLLIVYKK